jgi:hypothetical protein
MAQKFTVPVTIKNLSSAGSDGLTVFLDQESFARLKVEAGGRITWGAGSGAGDTNLYRDAESVLKTDDTFKAAGLYVSGTQIDTTGATVGDALIFNGTKFVSASVADGGASLTVSDTAPEDPSLGDLWFNSTDLEIYVYYSSSWIQVTDSSPGVQELYELVDVLIDNPVSGETLVYNGTEWVNEIAPAGTALSLETARAISISGDASGSVLFDGSQDVNITASVRFISGTEIDPSGATVGDALVFNGTKFVSASVAGGGGASLTVSDTPPPGASEGDLWFRSDTANTYVYYDSSWVEIGASGGVATLDDIGNVSASAPSSGDFLKWNGTAWINDPINLGTDTTGNYMSDLTQGTGVMITHTPSEGSNATIAIGQAVGTSASVQFAAVTAPLIGNASTATVLQTARNIAGQSFDGSTNISIAPTDLTGVTSSAAEINILDGATLSTTELNYVDGVTSAIQTQLDNKASSTASPIITLGGDLSGSATFTNLGNATLTATIEPNSVALGTDTTGNYMSDLTQGTGVTITHTPSEGSNATIAIGQEVGTSASVTFANINTTGDLVVGGDLTVNGTTTTLNTETLAIEDNIVVLNSNVTGSPTTNAGIEVERGTSTNVSVRWNETTDKWETTNDGSTYSVIATNGNIALGTDTTGNYMSGVSAGTGISVSHTPGEGSSASVSLDATLDDLSNVTATSPADGNFLKYVSASSSWVPAAIPTINALDDIGDVSVASPTVGHYLQWSGSAWTSASVSGGSTVTASTTPPSSPTSGSIWFDSGTAKTYVYYDSFWIEIGGTSGGAKMYVDLTAPSAPLEGQLWFKSDTAQTFAYYDSSWIEVGAAGMSAIAADVAPASPVAGQIWFDTDSGATYVYYDSYWIEVGAVAANTIFNLVDAKGDILVGTADNVLARQAVGTDGQLLQANSATTNGLQWFTPTYAPSASPTFTGTVVLPSTTSIGTVTSTEIGYVDGVTSAIQTQLDAKAPLAGPTFTGTVVLPSTTSIGTITSTELGYVDGVTSAIQTQLNTKAPTASPSFTGSSTFSGVLTATAQPRFLATRSGNLTYTGGNTVVFNATTYNVGSHFNTSTGLFTAPVAGNYVFSASIYQTAYIAQLWFMYNGARERTFAFDGGNTWTILAGASNIYLNVGDTLGIASWSDGGARTIYQQYEHTFFRGALIS